MGHHEPNKDKLLADVMTVIADTEELLRATADGTGDQIANIRARLGNHLTDAKIKMAEAQEAMMHSARQAGRATDDYVNENPWRAVGIAAGAGLLVGLLIGRR